MRRAFAALLLATTVVLAGNWALADKPEPDTLIQRADKQFQKKSYRKALTLYGQALKAEPEHDEARHMRLRVSQCHERLGEWDAAFSNARSLLKDSGGTLWEGRAAHQLALLSWRNPHWLSRKGDKVSIGKDQPGGRRVYTHQQDVMAGLKNAERALGVYELHRTGKRTAEKHAPRRALVDLIADIGLAAASTLEQQGLVFREDHESVAKTAWGKALIKAGYAFKPKDAAQRIVFLYEHVAKVSGAQRPKAGAKALYREAGYLTRLAGLHYDRSAQEFRFDMPRDRNPLKALVRLAERYPDSPETEIGRFQFARLLQNAGAFVKAVKGYRLFVKKHPKSLYVSDAKGAIQDITMERLSVSAPRAFLPGEEVRMQVASRNLKNVKFTAWRVSLQKLFLSREARRNPDKQFNNLGAYLTSRDDFVGAALGKPLSWKHETPAAGLHRPHNETIETPLGETGAWVVEAKGKDVTCYALVNISNLTFSQHFDRSGFHVYVTDSKTGKPAPKTNVLYKEVQRWRILRRQMTHVEILEGRSDTDGLYTSGYPRKAWRSASATQSVIAWRGEEYAITLPQWRNTSTSGSRSRELKAYLYTDRPVYRPGQKVGFRAIIREYKNGKYHARGGLRINVRINDSRGNKMYDKTLRTSEFGSIAGELTLGEKPPLGSYSINIRNLSIVNRYLNGGWFQFRVEEYKKPEYEVSVVASDPFLKLGGKGAFTIRARYYFGAPVTGAKVKYRVTRRAYWHAPSFPLEYSWLYDFDYNAWWQRRHGYRGGDGAGQELVLQGTGTLDEKGELKVDIDTAGALKKFPNTDHRYDVNVTVTDASRRNIDGFGTVKVTRRPFYAFLRPDRGFYAAGDKARIEVRAENPSGAPVSTDGDMVVYRLRQKILGTDVPVPAGRNAGEIIEEREEILREKAATDARGRFIFRWTPDEGGVFRVAFEARDPEGDLVEGGVRVTVVGEHFEGDRYRFGNVDILADKPVYTQGETARVLISTNFKNAWALVLVEAGDEILARQVVHIEDKVKLVKFAVLERHVPNFHLTAVIIRDGLANQATTEVFVPPVRQFINVDVKPAKPTTTPGGKAVVEVKTTDWRGRPVSAEVSLSVFDAATLAIARDTTTRIEKYFYGSRRWRNVRQALAAQYRPGQVQLRSDRLKPYQRHGAPPGFGYFYGGWDRFDRRNLEIGDYLTNAKDGALRKRASRARAFGGELAPMEEREMDDLAPSAPPAASAAPTSGLAELKSKSSDVAKFGYVMDGRSVAQSGSGGAGKLAEARVRENFADRAFWGPAVLTDSEGRAQVEITMPDSLTTWRIDARGSDDETSVGQAKSSLITRKNLLVRLQAPRFFVERDELTLSANVHNYLKTAKDAVVRLSVSKHLRPEDGKTEKRVRIEPGGHARVDWKVKVLSGGTVTVKMAALTDEESDAARMTFTAYTYGAQRHESATEVLAREDNSAVMKLVLPEARGKGSERMRITLNPSLAATLMDTLPYLIKYPYGCVEQTMSRFLPAVLVKRSLVEMGVDLGELRKMRGMVARRYPSMGDSYTESPVFSEAQLNRVIEAGLRRLGSFQHGDGGWAWWKDGESLPYMSAYVLSGLVQARNADVKVDRAMIDRGFAYLKRVYHSKELTNIHLATYIASVMSEKKGVVKREHLRKLFDRRDDLNIYSRALLAITLANIGDREAARTMIDNQEDHADVDRRAGTVHWETGNRGGWWWWYNNRVEANSAMLRAFLLVDPKNRFVPGIVKWIANNKKGTAWASTKETAHAVRALSEYIRREKELDVDYTLTVRLDGRQVRKVQVNRRNVFAFNNVITLGPDDLKSGELVLEIVKDGRGKLYTTAMLEYFSKEDHIRASGTDLTVKRRYFRLIPRKRVRRERGKDITVIEHDRVPIKEGDVLDSGDELEVALTVEAKNDYEYVVIEDMKPAGCEPVAMQSGFASFGTVWAHQEMRDEKVAFFISRLADGVHELSYRLRAEIPGTFHALPTQAQAMYAPDLKGNSDGFVMRVVD